MPNNQSYQDRRRALAEVAQQTMAMIPTVMADLPHLDAARSERLSLPALPPLDPAACPGFVLPGSPTSAAQVPTFGTPVRVFNQDSFDAAVAMPASVAGTGSGTGPAASATSTTTALLNHLAAAAHRPSNLLSSGPAARVAVLNMASEKNPGGGWLKGSSAQEEALCFRSTLAASLHRRWYPIPSRSGLYTPDVVVFRRGMGEGHALVTDVPRGELPVTSVLSVAGLRRPELVRSGGRLVFAEAAARALAKDKMRLCLRMAAARGHTLLVLGALGCGAFKNPPEEIADCWMEVLSEEEFAGGWFREIWFAVYDRRGEGNFEIFRDRFDGKVVGRMGSEST